MKNILYVEDDAINALVVRKLLNGVFNITHVFDGESCMQRVAESPYDAILMDINLGRGKMDGVETMKRIKSQSEFQKLPIVAITSYAMPEDKERFLGEGFNGYLSKPVERPVLLDFLGTFFQ